MTVRESEATIYTLVKEQRKTNSLLEQLNHNVVNLVLLTIGMRGDVTTKPTDSDLVGVKMVSNGVHNSDRRFVYYYHPDKETNDHPEYSNMTIYPFEDITKRP